VNRSSRRLLIWSAILVAMLIVIAGSSSRQTTPTLPLPAPAPATASNVVQGQLPADKTIRVRAGEVVRIQVKSVSPDLAQIFSLGVSTPVGPGLNAPLEFVANQPGTFEVTLRYSGERVGRVVVAAAKPA
jgi:heme/copper-type cytochrome/quinol oxidase subunit 2